MGVDPTGGTQEGAVKCTFPGDKVPHSWLLSGKSLPALRHGSPFWADLAPPVEREGWLQTLESAAGFCLPAVRTPAPVKA